MSESDWLAYFKIAGVRRDLRGGLQRALENAECVVFGTALAVLKLAQRSRTERSGVVEASAGRCRSVSKGWR